MNSNLDPSAPLAAHLAAYARPLLGDAEYHRIGNLLADDRAGRVPTVFSTPKPNLGMWE